MTVSIFCSLNLLSTVSQWIALHSVGLYLHLINLNLMCEMKILLSTQCLSYFPLSSISTTHTWIKSRPLTIQCLKILTVQSPPQKHIHAEQSPLIIVEVWKHTMLLWCSLRYSLLWLKQSITPQRPGRQTFPLSLRHFKSCLFGRIICFSAYTIINEFTYPWALFFWEAAREVAFWTGQIINWMQIDSIKCMQWDKRVTKWNF